MGERRAVEGVCCCQATSNKQQATSHKQAEQQATNPTCCAIGTQILERYGPRGAVAIIITVIISLDVTTALLRKHEIMCTKVPTYSTSLDNYDQIERKGKCLIGIRVRRGNLLLTLGSWQSTKALLPRNLLDGSILWLQRSHEPGALDL